jgi:ankyrin repeat protein
MSNPDTVRFDAGVDTYQKQAEALFEALKSGEESAAWRFKWLHPRFRGKLVSDVKSATLARADAQLVIAREFSFDSWAELTTFSTAVQQNPAVRRFETAVEAIISGDMDGLKLMLRDHPELVRARSTRNHHATLLHYIAANGVEGARQKTPPNAVEIGRLLLQSGAEVDALADMYDQKCTTMSMLVSSCHPAKAGLQEPLAELLLDHGASLTGPGSKWQSAVMTALTFGYLDTAKTLVLRGAPVDNLTTAAGLGRLEEAARFLATADPVERQGALALAAQHGHTEIVRLLLDAHEDPNRYNPEGFHAHSTPLHQAICAGHADVTKLLVERGARLDIRDTVYQSTPLGWAIHCEKPAIVDYLRANNAPA